MKNFVVRNTQTFRTVTLYGRVLASAHVGGRTNRMFLTKAELLGPPCVDKLRSGVLALVHGNPPEELAALMLGHEVMDVPAAIAPLVSAEVVRLLSISTESVEPIAAPESTSTHFDESTPPVVPPTEEAPLQDSSEPIKTPEPPSSLPTREDLNHFTVKELKSKSEELGIEVSGSKSEIISQILKSYGVSDAS